MIDGQIAEAEIDVFDYAQRGEDVPHGKKFRVRIDCETVTVDTAEPKGELLLAKVGKRPCAFELIAEFVHCDNRVIEPAETVDLRQQGLKGFITAHKEIVTIFIGGPEHPYRIERGERTVTEILAKVDKTPAGYALLEEKDGQPPLPVPADKPVKIEGCEMFFTQPQTGASS